MRKQRNYAGASAFGGPLKSAEVRRRPKSYTANGATEKKHFGQVSKCSAFAILPYFVFLVNLHSSDLKNWHLATGAEAAAHCWDVGLEFAGFRTMTTEATAEALAVQLMATVGDMRSAADAADPGEIIFVSVHDTYNACVIANLLVGGCSFL